MFNINRSKQADKYLRKLPNNIAIKIIDKIEHLARNPYAMNNNVKRLQGEDNYRLRVGNYRVIYYINDDIITINIIRINHRKDIYQ